MVEKNENKKKKLIDENEFNMKPKSAEDFIDLADRYMWEGDVMDGIAVIKILEELILDGEVEFKEKKGDLSNLELYNENRRIQNLLKDGELIFKCIDTYKHICKREPDRSNEGVDNWFKYEEKINSITICGRTVLKTKMINIIAMFKEMDLLVESSNSSFLNLFIKFPSQNGHVNAQLKCLLLLLIEKWFF